MLRPKNKREGRPLPFSSCRDFANYVDDCRLLELDCQGQEITLEKGGTFETLDQVFANINWKYLFWYAFVQHLAYKCYDHMPIMVTNPNAFN